MGMMVNMVDNKIKVEKNVNKYPSKCKRRDAISIVNSGVVLKIPEATPNNAEMSSVSEEEQECDVPSWRDRRSAVAAKVDDDNIWMDQTASCITKKLDEIPIKLFSYMTQEEGQIPVQISSRPHKGKNLLQISNRSEKGYTKASQQQP